MDSNAPTHTHANGPATVHAHENGSGRIGACGYCRAKKIKCSGTHPCVVCEKHSLECVYPEHQSRKRKDKSNSASAAPRQPQSQAQTGRGSGGGTGQGHGVTFAPMSDGMADWRLEDDLFGMSNLQDTAGPSTVMQPTVDPLTQWHFSPQDLSTNTAIDMPLEQLFGADPFLDLSFLNNSGAGTEQGQGGQEIDWAALGLNMNMGMGAEDQDRPSVGDGEGRKKGIPMRFRVPYFRFLGPTAVASGYRSFVAAMSRPGSPRLRPMRLGETDIMDREGEYPSDAAILELVPLFHQHFNYAFPSITVTITQCRQYAPQLINAMCALAARYSSFHRPTTASTEESSPAHVWSTKAKQQVSLQLAVPSLDTVETLLLLAWNEFGQDRDSGLWMYSGMAARMGQDLGLDPNVAQSGGDLAEGGDEMRRLYLLSSLYMLDACLTMGTGRFGIYSVPSETFSITYPELASLSSTPLPHPHTFLLKSFILVARMVRVLLAPTDSDAEVAGSTIGTRLARVQMALDRFIGELPPALRFDTASFQAYAAVGQGGAFALLHVWLHATIIFAFEPSITSDEPHDDTPAANKLISASSAKTILDIAVFAELIDPKAITQPWIGYPLYVAGRTFLAHSRPIDTSQSSLLMARQSRASCQRCIDILAVPMSKWAGVRYLRVALEQKCRGVMKLDLGQLGTQGEQGEGGEGAAEASPEVMPDKLSEWLASSRHGDDVVGLSLAGSFNSPSGNRVDLIARTRQ